jgi:uncharacterized protein (TIGR00251 family)
VTPSTRLQLRVSPAGSREQVVGRHGDAWKVRVAAPPEDGKANDAVLRLLAEALGLPRRDVALVSGHTGRDKVVSLVGIGAEETDRRLASAAAGRGKGTA